MAHGRTQGDRSRRRARQLAWAGALATAAAAASCGSAVFDANAALDAKNQALAGQRVLASKADVERERVAKQERVIDEYRRCPGCFVKKHKTRERGYLFDAVVDCDTSLRVGRLEDGGKWVCNPHLLPRPPIVYSFGVGEDISFDMDMAGLFGSHVFMFDPTPSVVKHFGQTTWDRSCGQGHLYYEALGVGAATSPAGLELEGKKCPVKTVADIAHALNHRRIDILKMDIEGGEYPALKQVLETGALSALGVQQVLIEFHLWNDQAFADFVALVDAFKRQGYLLFRKEFNAGNAFKCAEYAFVKSATAG